MKIRKEYLFLLAVILGLCLFLFLNKTNRVNYRLPEIPAIDTESITRLDISSSGTTVNLNKKDDKWYLGPDEYRADPHKVRNMLDLIEDIKLTALASDSGNFVRYDLTGVKKIQVKAWEEDELKIAFDIGKRAPTHMHTFVRLPEDPNIYQAEGNFRDMFDQDMNQLRDKKVLAFDKEDIRRIEILKDNSSISFQRKEVKGEAASAEEDNGKGFTSHREESVWITEGGEEIKNSKMEELFNILHDLRCKEHMEGENKEDFTDPLFCITLSDTGEFNLCIFPKKDETEKGYPAVSSQSKTPFYLDPSTADQIMTKLDH